MKPTFEQQFNKLTEAYIKNRVNPYTECACFVGNLLNGNEKWAIDRNYSNEGKTCTPLYWRDMNHVIDAVRQEADNFYTPEDIDKLEKTFLFTYHNEGGRRDDDADSGLRFHEDALFKAFEVTLDLLKKIHEEKGEIVELHQFKKRQLQTS